MNDNYSFNSIALRIAKTPHSFGHSECTRVKLCIWFQEYWITVKNTMYIIIQLKSTEI